MLHLQDFEVFILPCSKRTLAEMTNKLFELGEISGKTIFIDGTKIEASANKYIFVWKKDVTKNQEHLRMKLANLIAECEQLYDIKINYKAKQVAKKFIKQRRRIWRELCPRKEFC